jgi:hypothetical protein
MAKTLAISVRVLEGVKRELHELADAEGLTLAQYVERVLLTHIVNAKRKAAAEHPAVEADSSVRSASPNHDCR